MILQALIAYYEKLAERGEIAKSGWGVAKVSFALSLSSEGELLQVLSLKEDVQRGKKTVEVAKELMVPAPEKRTVGIVPNFMCDSSTYLLGVDQKGKPERAMQCFAAAKELHLQLLEDAKSPGLLAVRSFYSTWDPSKAAEHPVLAERWEEITEGGNLVFWVEGSHYAHDKEPFIDAVCQERSQEYEEGFYGQCLVTGKVGPIARLHPSIKGCGGQPSGVSLVSFNDRAYESYGREKEQGMNAPVSTYAAFAYTTALNHLLAHSIHKKKIGDLTLVYWSETGEKAYANLFGTFVNDDGAADDMQLDHIMQNIQKGKLSLGGLEPNTRFYILGLVPNIARLSVSFFLQDSFGNFLKNIAKHYDDLEMVRASFEPKYIPVPKLMEEVVNRNAKVPEHSRSMESALLRSILFGKAYPESFYDAVIRRVRADQDNPNKRITKISYIRAAIIKAYLSRNTKPEEGLITVSLNNESKHPAYVLGRLFAVLEKIQEEASPGLNATIKDRLFNSACATPAQVFPSILKLSGHHLRKMPVGNAINREKLMGELMDKLEMNEEPFPKQLNLQEEGIFILGYYHQRQWFFTKKEDRKEEEA